MYTDEEAAALYDVLNTWGQDDDFYLGRAMRASSVLDVGCGTGRLLHRVRDQGHRGRLVGNDPDPAMLRRARRREDITWVQGDAASMRWYEEFDLALMTGNAFQCLVDDSEIRRSLAAIHRALAPGGAFVFETRNPAARAWESWQASAPSEVTDEAGRRLTVGHDVLAFEGGPDGGIVEFTETTRDGDGTVLRVDRARLRFLGAEVLAGLLADTGFVVERQQGGWPETRRDAAGGAPDARRDASGAGNAVFDGTPDKVSDAEPVSEPLSDLRPGSVAIVTTARKPRPGSGGHEVDVAVVGRYGRT